MKERAGWEINAVAGEWGMLTLQPHGPNLSYKVHDGQNTAVYSDAVNIALSCDTVV